MSFVLAILKEGSSIVRRLSPRRNYPPLRIRRYVVSRRLFDEM